MTKKNASFFCLYELFRLKNIFDSGELNESAVCAKFAHTASDGKNYMMQFYNLDAVISVGYRVNR